MERIKNVLFRMLHPALGWIALLTILSTVSLFFVFLNGLDEAAASVLVYLMAAYTLSTIALKIPTAYKDVVALLHGNKYSHLYLTDRAFRAGILLLQGAATSVLFAAFHFATALLYRSVWSGAVAVYYLVLGSMRLLLLKNARKAVNRAKDRLVHELRSYRLCGAMMFALNVAMAGMIIQMVWQNKGGQYPGLTIYASAAYAFYSLSIAIMNTLHFRNMQTPILSASKLLSFAGALMSILTLQTALLSQFGADADKDFRQVMNAVTGGGVALLVFGMAIFMIVRANKELEKQRINNSQT